MSSRNSIFAEVDPTYGWNITGSISLILGGGNIDTQSVITGSTDTIASSNFYLAGVGFKIQSPYEDTLFTARELWIPVSSSEGVSRVVFKVDERTTNGDWIHLWTNYTGSTISGSWVVNGFSLAENPYETYEGSYSSLDYSCSVLGPGNIVFVNYVPTAFDLHGEYNALLNNASSESNQNLYTVDVYEGIATRRKLYIADDHKVPAKGGEHAGNYINLSPEASKYQQKGEFINQFSSQLVSGNFQTLDLAFLSYRAFSASIFVDRTFEGAVTGAVAPISTSLEEIWIDLQNGNEEPTETVYFSPQSSLDSGSVTTGVRSAVPVTGSILFKVDSTRIVRHTKATLYVPFMNTVFRTDEFGVVTDFYPKEQN